MKHNFLPLTAVAIVLASSTAQAQQQKADYETLLAIIVPSLGHQDIEKRREPQQKWQTLCLEVGANVHEAERKKVCLAMTKHLGADVNVDARVFLIRQLERIGREESVDALSKTLADDNSRIRECARRALAANPSSAAGDALRKALTDNAEPRARVKLINALGYRGKPASVKILAESISTKEPAVSAAAANALAKIDNKLAILKIRELVEGQSRNIPEHFARAYLVVAGRYQAKGETKKAARMFETLAKAGIKTPLRLAIVKGHLETCHEVGGSAGEMVEYYLTGSDMGLRQVAAGHVRHLNDEWIKKLAQRCSSFEKPAQIALLRGLGPTGNTDAALPSVVKLAKSDDAEVRLVAIEALAGLADETTVPFLLKMIDAGGDDGIAALNSLVKVQGRAIDGEIVDALVKTRDAGKKKQLLQLLDRRRATSKLQFIFRFAEDDDKSVRQTAVQIASRLAAEKDLFSMIAILAATKDRGEKDQVEKAIVTICRRNPDPDKQADEIIKVYRRTKNRTVQLQLLPLLGRIGGDNSLALIRENLSRNDDAESVDASVSALANWPTAQVTDDLIRVSTHENQNLRIRSVRALARIVVLKDERTDEERLQMLKKTMEKAERDQERDLILDRAKAVRQIETLRFVVPYLENEKLQQRACRTIVDLAHHRGLREPNQAEFDKALATVIELTTDGNLKNRARSYMSKK